MDASYRYSVLMPDCPHPETVPFTDEGDVTFRKRPRRWVAWKLVCLAERTHASVYEQKITVRDRNGKELANLWVGGNLYGEGVRGAFGFKEGEDGGELVATLPYGTTITVSDPYIPQHCSCHDDD